MLLDLWSYSLRIPHIILEMEMRLVKTLWGVNGSMDPSKWDQIFGKIAGMGYRAVETIELVWALDSGLFKTLLDKHGNNAAAVFFEILVYLY